jgi:hypothetical protein
MWNVVRPLGDGPANREALEPQQSKPQATSRLLYPVRAIRRKNIGEAILLATLLRGRLAVTLPPRNDSDLARHSRWKRFTRDLGLPVLFDAGLDRDLKALMAETSVAVSTSLNEGFGFALLEPWTSRVPVVGRRISHVCGDFEKAGIAFPWMYESLPVRLEWFDHSAFADRWRQALSAGYRSFGKDLDARSIAAAWSALTDGGEMDFGALDEQAQREVIIELHSSDQARRKALPPALEACQRGFDDADRRVVERNGAAILRSYEIGRYAQLLDEVYEAASTIAVTQAVDRQTLLDAFLAPATFRMLEQR